MAFAGYCQVIGAGATLNGETEVKLRPEGQWADNLKDMRFFYSHPQMGRQVLATALAAITSKTHVWCEMSDDKTPYARVERFFIGD
jgi:hypothetical protein